MNHDPGCPSQVCTPTGAAGRQPIRTNLNAIFHQTAAGGATRLAGGCAGIRATSCCAIVRSSARSGRQRGRPGCLGTDRGWNVQRQRERDSDIGLDIDAARSKGDLATRPVIRDNRRDEVAEGTAVRPQTAVGDGLELSQGSLQLKSSYLRNHLGFCIPSQTQGMPALHPGRTSASSHPQICTPFSGRLVRLSLRGFASQHWCKQLLRQKRSVLTTPYQTTRSFPLELPGHRRHLPMRQWHSDRSSKNTHLQFVFPAAYQVIPPVTVCAW